MNIRLVVNLLGKALAVEGALMLPSLLVSLYYDGGDWLALLLAAMLVSAVGARWPCWLGLTTITCEPEKVLPRWR